MLDRVPTPTLPRVDPEGDEPVQDTPLRAIRVLLVDDEPGVRRGLRIRLGAERDLVVVGDAADGDQVIGLVHDLTPDVVVMDASMPRLDGVTATRLMRTVHPTLPVVMLSLYDDRASRTAALEAGAAAFVSKHDADVSLLDAIRGAHFKR